MTGPDVPPTPPLPDPTPGPAPEPAPAPGPPAGSACPICGGTLDRVTGQTPDSAPLLCHRDRAGWWPSEVTPQARALFDGVTRAWPQTAAAQAVRDQVSADRRAAREEARRG